MGDLFGISLSLKSSELYIGNIPVGSGWPVKDSSSDIVSKYFGSILDESFLEAIELS